METYKKIRMDILIEAPFKNRLKVLLDAHGVSGYTIFSPLEGKGLTGDWARAGMITDFGQMLLCVCIVDGDRRDPILDELRAQLFDHVGFVTLSEVEVIRPSKFA